MEQKLILFDFDGVVADSFTPAFETAKTICPLITEMEYRKRFEGNINETKFPEDFHSEACRHDLDFFSLYIPRIKDEVTIFPGMKEVILTLEKEYTLVIISSTLTFPIEEFLVSHDLRNHFEWVMGNDVHKSKTEKIKMVFQKYGVGENDCVFITDTLGDMYEAEKVGVQSIGVTWGFNTAETLTKGNPFRLAETPSEIVRATKDYFKYVKEVEALKRLAERELQRIEKLPQPVVRVCGPLTCDGPEGYERNVERLAEAEKVLQLQGMSVWTFGEAEEEIYGKGYDHGNILTYFHKPVLTSGLIKVVYFLPRWNESNGAAKEREIAEEAHVSIQEFPEEWFENSI